MFDFLSKITPDGWISFGGSLFGAVLTLISMIIAWKIGKNQARQKEREQKKAYYDILLRQHRIIIFVRLRS